MSVCGVSSIAAFRPTPCPAETQHSVPQHCPPGLLAGGRRPSESGGKWLLKAPFATKTASDSPRTHFVLRGQFTSLRPGDMISSLMWVTSTHFRAGTMGSEDHR